MANSKLMSASDAVRRFVHDGDKVFLGYTSWAAALEREIVRQHKKDLIPVATVGSLLLPLAGCASRIITSNLLGARSSYFMERYRAGEFKVEDYTNQTIALMFLAGALGIPFIPTRSMLGTDYLKDTFLPQPGGFLGDQKLRVMNSPFGGEQIVALPAIRLDVSCVHVQWADEYGNACFWGGHGEVKWALWASERIIISAEEIVPSDELRSDPHRTTIPGALVDAVVHLPFGALPWGIAGYHAPFARLQAEYLAAMDTKEGFGRVMSEWVEGCQDHDEFLGRVKARFGEGILDGLRVDRKWSAGRNIEYGWKAQA